MPNPTLQPTRGASPVLQRDRSLGRRWRLSFMFGGGGFQRVRVTIPEMWRDRLRDMRQRQLPDWSHYMLPVEAEMGTEVVLLQYGMGTASFLGLDGRGYFWNAAEDIAPRPIDHDSTVSGLLVWASHVQPGMPDLAELLPPPNAGGVTCPCCEGLRWLAKPEEEWPGGWVCMACRGMGWVGENRVGILY